MTQAPAGWGPIVRHYEACLEEHGASPKGVDWPNGEDLAARFGVMLELLDACPGGANLLDLGCGPGLLLDYLTAAGRLGEVEYQGVDLSASMIEAARRRWPDQAFICRDILADPLPERSVDVVLMNGVLTERRSLSETEMTDLAQAIVAAAFKATRVGIAFNVMSAHVDWRREDLFHWKFDDLAAFLKAKVSRHVSFRADYGLYEYSCFVWREPRRPAAPSGEWWVR